MEKTTTKRINLVDVSPTHRDTAYVVQQRAFKAPQKTDVTFRLRIALDSTATLANIYMSPNAIPKQHELYQAMLAEKFHMAEVSFTNLRLFQNEYCIYGYADDFEIIYHESTDS